MSAPHLTRYRVAGIIEETQCDRCGWPLTTGDWALDVDEGAAVACSRACARSLVDARPEDTRQLRELEKTRRANGAPLTLMVDAMNHPDRRDDR